MNYVAFGCVLRRHRLEIFTLRDVTHLFPNEKKKTIKNNLGRWASKGYCLRLRRNLYQFLEPGAERAIPDLYLANRLYEPSYVSLETALSFYSIIPDVAAGVTSVTTRSTRTFRTKSGSFFYRTCQRKAFTGYRLMRCEGFQVCMADKEKALIDFLYFRARESFALDYERERLNKTILKKINWKKAIRLAGLYGMKTVEAVKACKEYVTC